MAITIKAANGENVVLNIGDTLVDEFAATAIENHGGRYRAQINVGGSRGDRWVRYGSYATQDEAQTAADIEWDRYAERIAGWDRR